MRKTNAIKARKARARNFGGEAVLVRSMDCIVHAASVETGMLEWQLTKRGWTACGGAACAHHVHPRQRGGVGEGRFGLFNACARHGEEAGEASPIHGPSSKRRKFESLYSVDVVRIADDIALAHDPPLGIRGLAARWAAAFDVDRGGNPVVFHSTLLSTATAGSGSPSITVDRLVGYDLAALMAWTRRRMETELASCREQGCDQSQDWNAMIGAVQEDLNWEYHAGNGPCFETAVALCEQAGWPGVQDGRGVPGGGWPS